jgi:tetratricopeptide (TPR) repeat protein
MPLSIKVAILHAEKRDDEVTALLNADVDRRQDFASYLRRAEYLASAGRAEAAEADFLRLTTFRQSAAEGYAALARFHLSQGRFDKALAACEEGLKVDSANTLVRRTLVKACLASPDPALRVRAAQVLGKLLEEMPNDIELQALQAGLKLSTGTPEATAEATAILERIVDLDPRQVGAQLQLIQMAQARGDRQEVDERILRALGANPRNSDLLLARVRLDADRGDVTAALQFARAAADADPQSKEARSLLVVLAIRAGDLDTARAQVDLWRKTDPDGEATQVAQARLLAGQKRGPEAVEVLETYRRGHADSAGPDLLLLLAELHRQQGNDEASGRCIDQVLSRTPDNAAARLARVRWLGAAGKLDDLRAILDGQSLENPGHLPIVMAGASVLASSGSDDAVRHARVLFEQVRKRYPGRLDAALGVAVTAYRLGDRDGAVQAYRRALELDPYQRQALNDLAWILGVETGKPQEAIEFADRGVARYPDDPHLLDTRGVLLTQLGRLADARTDLERCIEVAKGVPPTEAKARLHLARVHVKLGEPAAATQQLQEAAEIDNRHHVLSDDEKAEIRGLVERASPPP